MPAIRKVYFYPIPNREQDVADVKVLVAALDCAEEVSDLADADVVVVLVCAETVADPQLEEALGAAADGAFSVLGVYAQDSNGTLPSVLEDYGCGFVPLDIDKLRAAICEEATLWEDTSGSPRPEPDTPRRCS